MKLSVKCILLTTTMAMISLANGKESIGNPTVTAVQQMTVIRSAPAHVKHKKTLKSKIQRTVPYGMDDQDDDFGSEIDFQVAYRRPELVKVKYNIFDDDEELPTHITDRLAQIRELALARYREVNQNQLT